MKEVTMGTRAERIPEVQNLNSLVAYQVNTITDIKVTSVGHHVQVTCRKSLLNLTSKAETEKDLKFSNTDTRN